MITKEQYFGKFTHTDEKKKSALIMLDRVNRLLHFMQSKGVKTEINPATGCEISGQTYGGFRPQDCPQGAPLSSHKQGMAVDIYDPKNEIDAAITDAILLGHDLYREAPEATHHWAHLSTRSPASGHRTFKP